MRSFAFLTSLLRICLLPIAWCYDAVTSLRNMAFDRGWLSSQRYPLPLIGVGNLAVGGTGKTPHAQWIVEQLLNVPYRVAVLSRGYGRKTRGFLRITTACNAATVGDEPLQLFRHFAQRDFVGAVCERRTVGVEQLLKLSPSLDVIVLDDAFQHRYVAPGLQILLTDYHHTYDEDKLLPAGRLRENIRGALRADVIIVTKCPIELTEEERCRKENALRAVHPLHPSSDEVPIFFTAIDYPPLPHVEKALLITGIANPRPLFTHLEAQGVQIEHLSFADHHKFSKQERVHIIERAAHYPIVFTTEKDAVRLEDLRLPTTIQQKIHPIPITIQVLFNEETHLSKILTHYVSSNTRNRSVD